MRTSNRLKSELVWSHNRASGRKSRKKRPTALEEAPWPEGSNFIHSAHTVKEAAKHKSSVYMYVGILREYVRATRTEASLKTAAAGSVVLVDGEAAQCPSVAAIKGDCESMVGEVGDGHAWRANGRRNRAAVEGRSSTVACPGVLLPSSSSSSLGRYESTLTQSGCEIDARISMENFVSNVADAALRSSSRRVVGPALDNSMRAFGVAQNGKLGSYSKLAN